MSEIQHFENLEPMLSVRNKITHNFDYLDGLKLENIYDELSGDDVITVDDLRVQGDTYVSGEVFTQQGSVSVGNISFKSSNDRSFIVSSKDNKIYLQPRIELSSGGASAFSPTIISQGTKETVIFDPYTKDDATGQIQTSQTTTLSSVYDATTEKHTQAFHYTADGNLWMANWYLRSSTGFDNYMVQAYNGHLDLNSLAYELDGNGVPRLSGEKPFWQSVSDKDFNTNNALSAAADVANDIEVPLNTSTGFIQNDTEQYTIIAFANAGFEYEAGDLNGADFPYMKVQGLHHEEINKSSTIIFNGNSAAKDFDVFNAIESKITIYYGTDTVLDAGVYDKVEVPYFDADIDDINSYMFYAIILDQDSNTIAYANYTTPTPLTGDGTITITFDKDVLIKEAGIYQFVFGIRCRKDNETISLLSDDINASAGAVWSARGGNNPTLNQDDTSSFDWTTVNKTNDNSVFKTLIYKY